MPAKPAKRFSPAAAKRIKDDRYTAAVIPPFVLAGLIDCATARGIDPRPWFAGVNLTLEQCYEPDTRISFRQAAAVLRRGVRAFPTESVGFAIGSREPLASFGLVGFAMMSARTFGEAASIALEYHQLSGTFTDVSVETGARELMMLTHERFAEPALLQFFCEEAFASSVAMGRALLGPSFRPARLELSYPPPIWSAQYQRLFRCPVQFNARRNAFIIDIQWMEHKLPTHNPAGLAEALRLCRLKAESDDPKNDLSMALEVWIRGRLSQCPTSAQAAEAFHLTERTLRRRLASLGTNYQQVYDSVRAARAKVLLSNPDLRVNEVSTQLGFSDAREFRRAFKRWTGLAPQQWAMSQS